MPPPPTTWQEAFLELLCRMYQRLGGDCEDLTSDPSTGIAVAEDKYQTSGLPDMSPAETELFTADLGDITNALASPENTLDPSDTQRMSNLITEMKNDLGV